VTEFSQ